MHRPARILIVDDEPGVRAMLSDTLADATLHPTCAADGFEALGLILRQDYDIVLADITMPQMTGLDLVEKIREQCPRTRTIIMTGSGSSLAARDALKRGAFDYIEKPIDPAELRQIIADAIEPAPAVSTTRGPNENAIEEMGHRFNELQAELRRTCLQSVMAFVAAVEAKDPYTERHSKTVAFYAKKIADRMRMPADQVDTIRTAAVLHDIGKIGIPDAILTKPTKLTNAEFDLVKQHPRMGVQILEHTRFLKAELPLVLHHHEHWDGTGYPMGLRGEQIPLGARVLHVADAIDAMASTRSYRDAFDNQQVMSELRLCRGTQFDPKIAGVAIEWIRDNPHLIPMTNHRPMPRVAAS